jgi:hypothetical protein
MWTSIGLWGLAETALPRLARWRVERGAFAAVLGAVFFLALAWWGWR